MRPEPIPPNGVSSRFEDELKELRAGSLYRRLTAAEQPDFCSNDYLGLSRDPMLIGEVRKALASAQSVSSTGSRLLSGHGPQWEALESEFATFVGTGAALFMGSGYAANLGLLGAMLRPDDTVYSDASNHASLIDGMRLSGCRKVIFPHLDLDFLEDSLAAGSGPGERFIVVESLFSMDGDRTPFDELAWLAERYDAGLIVDEAHATGVFGADGRGLIPDRIRRSGMLIAAVYTCGKALASPGAFVAGSPQMVELLVNKARTFIFSTAPPPYVAAQVSAAVRRAKTAALRRQEVRDRAERLRGGLRSVGIDTGASDSQIVPVIVGSNQQAVAVTDRLREDGFIIRPIRPPTVPEGTARLRLSVTADTSLSSIDRVIEAIGSLGLQ
jgi:8-amino-7-oxononanoate synthase